MPYLIAGNWKMNNTVSQTKSLIKELEAEHVPNALVSVVVSPSFLSLETAVKSAKTLSVSSQNIHWEESGAFTGEVSAKMLTEIGVTHAIIGHSERRQYFAETDETETFESYIKGMAEQFSVPMLMQIWARETQDR